jgi:pimeloyl-ACP methyl ester carboxylesterase
MADGAEERHVDVVSRFVAIGDGGDDGNLQMLVHERRDVEGPQHAGEMCPPVVIMAPGVEGGLGPGLEAAAAGTEPAWGADCDPALLGSSVYSQLGQALAADHGMLCVQLSWREPGGGLEAAATDLLLAMRWSQERQSEWSDDARAPMPDVWLIGFGFGGAALLTAADFLGVLDPSERPQLGAVALMATALAGPTTGGEDFEQRDLPRALHGLGAPVLLLQGAADTTVPPRAALDAFACSNSSVPGFKRLVLIHDGDHRFTTKRADTVSYLRGWAREQLKGTVAPLLPDGFQGFDTDDELQQTVRRARAAGPERRAAAAAAAARAAEVSAETDPLEIHVDAAQARLAVSMGRSDAEVEGRLKSLREDEAAQRVQIEQMQAQIEMLKTKKRDMEQITAMLASQTVAAASAGETDDADDDGDPQPEESTSESESGEKKQSEEDAWNEYGDVLETGLAELRALRTQLRS